MIYVARAIARDPEIIHGVPVFRGMRVTVQTLFDYPEGGDTLEDFLAGFPTLLAPWRWTRLIVPVLVEGDGSPGGIRTPLTAVKGRDAETRS